MERVAETVASWVLRVTEQHPFTLTPRRLRRLSLRLASFHPADSEVRDLMDSVLEVVSQHRKVRVERKGSGRRVATVMPSWLESNYLDVE